MFIGSVDFVYSEIRENGTRMFRRCLQEFFLNRDISVAI